MFYVGIDIAKDKHDCYITDSNGNIAESSFTIKNNSEGFEILHSKIKEICTNLKETKIGLEATGHYSYNILNYLIGNELTTYVLNPLHTNRFRKGQTLRNTKTDKLDAKIITTMLKCKKNIKPYTSKDKKYEEIKSLSRYRFKRVEERAKLKTSVARLVNILFPELDKEVKNLDSIGILELLQNFPGASYIANANANDVLNIINDVSHGYYNIDFCNKIINLAKISIGMTMEAKSIELKHTIKDIKMLNDEISEIEKQINLYLKEIKYPIMTIPGIGPLMGSLIIGEIGDFSRFDNADIILAYAGMSPTTYQSGQLDNSHPRMEKHGSKYLRYALFNATTFVCHYEPTFKEYLEKKLSEGKHYYVAISHATKKLVRMMYHLVTTNKKYEKKY